tara:strand:+ start:404 stop:700 length:297 start_codon:yes stop_codon:yes gene_type:complete
VIGVNGGVENDHGRITGLDQFGRNAGGDTKVVMLFDRSFKASDSDPSVTSGDRNDPEASVFESQPIGADARCCQFESTGSVPVGGGVGDQDISSGRTG